MTTPENDTTAKLLPCPFCGGTMARVTGEATQMLYIVHAPRWGGVKCGLTSFSGTAAAWNTRPTPDAAPLPLEATEAMLAAVAPVPAHWDMDGPDGPRMRAAVIAERMTAASMWRTMAAAYVGGGAADAADARVKALEEALEGLLGWGVHDEGCNVDTAFGQGRAGGGCDCGLVSCEDAARAALAMKPGEG